MTHCIFIFDLKIPHRRVPPGSVYSGGSLRILIISWLLFCMKYLLEADRIFSLSFCVPPPANPPAETSAPANAVLMQIRLEESTYYKQLTFVLIY